MAKSPEEMREEMRVKHELMGKPVAAVPTNDAVSPNQASSRTTKQRLPDGPARPEKQAHRGLNSSALHIQRTWPHSVEAEQGVLGSMIIDPRTVIPLVRQKIDSTFFYVPAHQMVFNSACRLFSDEGMFDLITFTQYLRDAGELETIGGAAAVTSLYTFIPTAANVTYYLEIVRDKHLLRAIIAASTETMRQAFEDQDSVDALMVDFSKRTELLKQLCDSFSDVVAVPLIALARADPNPATTLLGKRFLCRGGGMLFVGPSGIGKSSASVQQDVLWSLGREAFGIKPSRPLRILCVQAENDDEDLAEMARGVCDGLNLTESDREAVFSRVWYRSESARVGADLLQSVVTPLLAKYRPDLLRLDPMLAYIPGDVSDQSITSAFLRQGLNPLLSHFDCGAIINHHTPKVTNRDTSTWRASDWMYAGAGSADVTNWARAILVIDPTHAPRVFKMIAAKRGGRIGWADDSGEPVFERFFSHASGSICWYDATAEDEACVEESKPGATRTKTKDDLKALVPLNGEISKNALIAAAQNNGIGCNRARGLLDQLLATGELFQRSVPRPKTNPEIRISRSESASNGRLETFTV